MYIRVVRTDLMLVSPSEELSAYLYVHVYALLKFWVQVSFGIKYIDRVLVVWGHSRTFK